MEKKYKVKMYECIYQDIRNPSPVTKLYTSREVINLVNNKMKQYVENIQQACDAIRFNDGYIEEVIIEFTNDDFIGNIKPDNSITTKLDLGSFGLQVSYSNDLVQNFNNLSFEQQKIICEFIDKAEQVIDQINKRFNKTSYDPIKSKTKNILNKLVKQLFKTEDRSNPDAQIMKMRKFNDINLKTLFEFLTETINDMSVADLMNNDNKILTVYTDKFWHKIVVETAHNS